MHGKEGYSDARLDRYRGVVSAEKTDSWTERCLAECSADSKEVTLDIRTEQYSAAKWGSEKGKLPAEKMDSAEWH